MCGCLASRGMFRYEEKFHIINDFVRWCPTCHFQVCMYYVTNVLKTTVLPYKSSNGFLGDLTRCFFLVSQLEHDMNEKLSRVGSYVTLRTSYER